MSSSTNSHVFVYIPDVLETNNVGFLAGCIQKDKTGNRFYITNDILQDNLQNCIGYCGLSSLECSSIKISDWVHLTFSNQRFQITNVLCNSYPASDIVCIFYNYKSFKKSGILSSAHEEQERDFYQLSRALHDHEKKKVHKNHKRKLVISTLLMINGAVVKICQHCKRYLSFSSTYTHIDRSVIYIQEMLTNSLTFLDTGESVTRLQICSVLSSKFLNIIVGLLMLYALQTVDEAAIAGATASHIVDLLRRLLEFLMGSPVGLKLNNAFNSVLGNFFIYHMVLWRTFLSAMGPLLGAICVTLCVPLSLIGGFTFQTALAADLLGLATFHVHCIYVYAARLYGAQIHGLKSLCRLFLGRKYNPLKNRVDSYKYTNHQLFVGTLAFTVLLFLLPTTALYYVVFTGLRLVLVAIVSALEYAHTVIEHFPLYQVCLWFMNSPRASQNVHLQILETTDTSLYLHADLRRNSWPWGFGPFQQRNRTFQWTQFLTKLAAGHLI